MKLKNVSVIAAASLLLFGFGSSAAGATELAPQAPAVETLEADNGPEFISDAEMAEIDSRSAASGELTFTDSSGVSARALGVVCRQDTGVVYKRASGSGHLYGTVGAKPKITCANGSAAYLSLSTVVYKKVTGGYSKVAGAFKSQNWGAASLTQKSVEYVCKSSKANHYRVIATGTVQYAGKTPITASPYSDTQNKLTCG